MPYWTYSMTKYGGNTFKTMTIFYVADVMPMIDRKIII